jgi:hypothetical protein
MPATALSITRRRVTIIRAYNAILGCTSWQVGQLNWRQSTVSPDVPILVLLFFFDGASKHVLVGGRVTALLSSKQKCQNRR